MNFKEFDNLVNTNEDKMYIASVAGKPAIKGSLSDLRQFKDDPSLEISWVVQDNYLVIETEQTSILEVIRSRKEDVFVFSKGTTSLFIICKSEFARTTVLNRLACGINANTYGPGKVILLPFSGKNPMSENVKKLKYEYGKSIGQIPNWMIPVRKISNSVNDGIIIPILGNQQVVLLDVLSKLKSINVSQLAQKEIIELVNEEFCQTPLDEFQLDNILKISEDQLIKQFFDKDKFFHDRLGNYIIKNCYIKKDEVSKELYFYNEKKKVYSLSLIHI